MSSHKSIRKFFCLALAFASCMTVTACHPTTPDDPTPKKDPEPLYTETISEVIISSGKNRLAVNFCREDLVHFRFAPDGAEFLPDGAVPETVAKYDKKYAAVHGVVEETDAATVIRTAGVTVEVDKTTLGITVTDPAGKTIFKSAAAAFSVDGEGKTASFVRDVAVEEHFFGLGNDVGDDFITTDHRNTDYTLWLNDDNVHAIIPLWYSTAGYGIYLNNSNRGVISFKKDYKLSVEGGEMNFYFLWGPSFKTILSNWSELAGRMNMPPLYALGLTYRGYGSWNENQLRTAITSQYDEGIAIDVAGVEPGWQTKTYPCTYAWSTKFTSDAEAFVESMHDLGLHVNLWEHPYVSPDAAIYKDILEYSLKSAQIGTRAWEGNNGQYAFGGIVPDLTMNEARDLYWQIQNDNLVSIGIDGFKIDETDSWGANNSLTTLFPSGISNNAYHNLLGTLTVNLMHENYRDEYNLRSFIFSRGNYAGMQRFATSAYTDYYGFDQFLMSVIAQSYSGTYYTPEIRDVSTQNDASYMRRTQLMFLTPFAMSNEWASEATVLGRSQAVIDCYKKYNQLHYQLIPYMYSLFWNQHNTGIGVTRSLLLEFQDDPTTYKINNEFMLGDALLVCPVSSTARMATTKIYLPAGEEWIDYNTGYVYNGGQTIEYTSSASVLPLFVRVGSILPLGHYGNNTADVTDRTLTLDIYPAEREATFTLYEDDGISYDYQKKDEYAETLLTAKRNGNEIICTVGARTGKYAVANRSAVMQIHYRSAPTSVTLDGKKLDAAASLDAFRKATSPCCFYDAAESDMEKILYVRLTDDGKAHTVTATVGEQSAQSKPEVAMEGTLYECEDKANTQNGTSISSKATASGKYVVGNVGDNGKKSLTMNGITVPADGVYDVEIVYFNGSDTSRRMNVTINAGEVIPVSCPSNKNWDLFMNLTIPMELKKGTNTITFGTTPGDGFAPDLDCIIVYDKSPVEITLKGTLYSPADATMAGSLKLENCAGAVGGKAVGGIGLSADNKLTFHVTVPTTGPYQLNLNYSNASSIPCKVRMAVNGAESEIALAGTNSASIFANFNQTVYLNAGENTITFYSDAGMSLYECEVGGEYNNCNNKLTPPAEGYTQSGGYAVGATTSDGKASFTMKGITVPAAGTYQVQIFCASGDNRTFRLKVNGEDTGERYNCRTGHFHVFKPLELELELNAGENTLTVWQESTSKGDSAWLPNFDYIVLPDVVPDYDIRLGAISIQ